MAKKKSNTTAKAETPQPVQPAAAPEAAAPHTGPAPDAATPHTAAGVTRGAIPVPQAKRGGFVPPTSHFKGRGAGPVPKGGGNMRATSRGKGGARGR